MLKLICDSGHMEGILNCRETDEYNHLGCDDGHWIEGNGQWFVEIDKDTLIAYTFCTLFADDMPNTLEDL